MWWALLLGMLAIVLAEKSTVKRQHHLYGSTSEGPTAEMYLGEPTLACAPDMFPPGERHTVSVLLPITPRLPESTILNLCLARRCGLLTYSAVKGHSFEGDTHTAGSRLLSA